MNESKSPENLNGNVGRKRGLKFLPALGAVLLVGISLYASRAAVQPAGNPDQPDQAGSQPKEDDKKTAKAVAAVNAFLDKLDAQQRGKVLLEFDSAKKSAWSNLPVTMVKRNGIRLGDLNPAQRSAALAAIAAVLSKQGYQKVIDIMNADDQLVTKDNKMKFGTDNFYLAIFGKPSTEKPWMLQFGGHNAFNDKLTRESKGSLGLFNQFYPLYQQLELGVRHLDLDVSAQQVNGVWSYVVKHGEADPAWSFLTDRLNEIKLWLDHNPTEIVHLTFENHLSGAARFNGLSQQLLSVFPYNSTWIPVLNAAPPPTPWIAPVIGKSPSGEDIFGASKSRDELLVGDATGG